jgi:nucleoside-diphosphate-sugar epimerase
MTQRRALITGLAGFTGKYVASELAQAGYAVYGTGIAACDLPNYFQLDLLDQQALPDMIQKVQPHVVVHLAAVAFVGHGNPDDFYRVNLLGTRHLLGALDANARNLDAVLLVSSANVYGNRSEGQLPETAQPDPANDYAVSKLAMEQMAALWQHRLPLFIVRPFNYTGVGQSENFLIPKIVGHFRSKAPFIELGNLDVWRDFSDVRTVAAIYLRLLEVRPLGQVINVCSGNTYSLREVIAMAASITGHHIEIRVNPDFVRSNEVRHLGGDCSRLRSLLWEVPALPLQETLRWMLTE